MLCIDVYVKKVKEGGERRKESQEGRLRGMEVGQVGWRQAYVVDINTTMS